MIYFHFDLQGVTVETEEDITSLHLIICNTNITPNIIEQIMLIKIIS